MKKLKILIALSLLSLCSVQEVNANDEPLDEEPAFMALINPAELLKPTEIEYIQEDVIEDEVNTVDLIEETVIEPQEYITDWLKPCSTSNVKTYMDYKAITMVGSTQYQYIRNNMTIYNGLLYEGGYVGVALGSWWGGIGSKWTIELDTGIVLNVVKIDEKSDNHTYNGCQHISDTSVIEFVIDSQTIPPDWWGSNGLVFNGNFNNSDLFNGNILRISKGE